MNYELFDKLRAKFDFEKKPSDIFYGVIGYDGIKKVINTALISEKIMAILLAGPPGIGKSFIMKKIEAHYGDHAVWFDCSKRMFTAAGFRDFMYENPKMKILLMDELSRMSEANQEILLNFIAEGTITDTKSMRGYSHEKFKGIKIIATSNNPEKIIEPLRSRLDMYFLPQYTIEEFTNIAWQKYATIEDKELLSNAIFAVLHRFKSRDMRDLDKLMSYTVDSKGDLEELIQTKLQYSKKSRRTEY